MHLARQNSWLMCTILHIPLFAHRRKCKNR
nr:MAG TPA: hypothetical protein [Caudoviricetes sp.]DAL20482.1 MAG TPA_asm: hypothetical protein [Caudoviricetes sp.]